MHISRTRFVLLFLALAYVFLFTTGGLLDQPPESFFGAEGQAGWQRVVSIILSPIKLLLTGPLLPVIGFLHRDPDTPPPFFLVSFAAYWLVLALVLHRLMSRKAGPT